MYRQRKARVRQQSGQWVIRTGTQTPLKHEPAAFAPSKCRGWFADACAKGLMPFSFWEPEVFSQDGGDKSRKKLGPGNQRILFKRRERYLIPGSFWDRLWPERVYRTAGNFQDQGSVHLIQNLCLQNS